MNTTFKIVVLGRNPDGKIDNILPPVALEQSVPVLIV